MAGNFHYHFEWDPTKAATNRRKHEVAFEQAATVFRDPLAMTIYDQEHSHGEDRWITLGQDGNGVLLVVVHTYQAMNEESARIRIISARRATKRERHDYEKGI